ncbi:MAG: hypothetical protein OEZ54_00850 [Gemmatimonadota bacterium]|nr:hypothetical protein [Gemmatimonadota bacterium]
MLTRADVREQLELHLQGLLTLEDLSSWAEEVFREEEFEEGYETEISEVVSVLRDAVDPHRFPWEESDFEEWLEALQ